MDFGDPFGLFRKRKKNKPSAILEKRQIELCRRRPIVIKTLKPQPKSKPTIQVQPTQKEIKCTSDQPLYPKDIESDKSNTDDEDVENTSDDELEQQPKQTLKKSNKNTRLRHNKVEKKTTTRCRILQKSQNFLHKIKRPSLTIASSIGSYILVQQYLMPLVNVLNPQAFLTSAIFNVVRSATESFIA